MGRLYVYLPTNLPNKINQIYGICKYTKQSHGCLWVCKYRWLVGGWTNPFEKYARQNGFIFPKFRDENETSLKPPPRWTNPIYIVQGESWSCPGSMSKFRCQNSSHVEYVSRHDGWTLRRPVAMDPTLPETNIAPENWWLEDYFPCWPIFRGELLNFGGGGVRLSRFGMLFDIARPHLLLSIEVSCLHVQHANPYVHESHLYCNTLSIQKQKGMFMHNMHILDIISNIPVVPHKAVAEVSRWGKL